jgi:hypothetical protein
MLNLTIENSMLLPRKIFLSLLLLFSTGFLSQCATRANRRIASTPSPRTPALLPEVTAKNQQELRFYLAVKPETRVEIKFCAPTEQCPALSLSGQSDLPLVIPMLSLYSARTCRQELPCDPWQALLLHPVKSLQLSRTKQTAETFAFSDGPSGGAVSSLGDGNMIFSQYLLLDGLQIETDQKGKFSLTAPQGLHNFGNTCYLNSTLQLLFSDPEVHSALDVLKSETSSRGKFADSLVNLFAEMKANTPVDPETIKAVMRSYDASRYEAGKATYELRKTQIPTNIDITLGKITELERLIALEREPLINRAAIAEIRNNLELGPIVSSEIKLNDLKKFHSDLLAELTMLSDPVKVRGKIERDLAGGRFIDAAGEVSGEQRAASEFVAAMKGILNLGWRVDTLNTYADGNSGNSTARMQIEPFSFDAHRSLNWQEFIDRQYLNAGLSPDGKTTTQKRIIAGPEGPANITLAVERVKLNNIGVLEKVINPIAFSPRHTVELPFSSEAGSTLVSLQKMRLKSAIVHGGSGSEGHYITYVFDDGEIHRISDTLVEKLATQAMKDAAIKEIESNATVVHFERVPNSPPTAAPSRSAIVSQPAHPLRAPQRRTISAESEYSSKNRSSSQRNDIDNQKILLNILAGGAFAATSAAILVISKQLIETSN